MMRKGAFKLKSQEKLDEDVKNIIKLDFKNITNEDSKKYIDLFRNIDIKINEYLGVYHFILFVSSVYAENKYNPVLSDKLKDNLDKVMKIFNIQEPVYEAKDNVFTIRYKSILNKTCVENFEPNPEGETFSFSFIDTPVSTIGKISDCMDWLRNLIHKFNVKIGNHANNPIVEIMLFDALEMIIQTQYDVSSLQTNIYLSKNEHLFSSKEKEKELMDKIKHILY